MADKEIDALQAVMSALEGLSEDECRRVLRYVSERLGVVSSDVPSGGGSGSSRGAQPQRGTRDLGQNPFHEFAELFAEAQPRTDKEKALVAAYWVQVIQGEDSFVSQALNVELKHLGHGVGNITDALDRLIEERPQLVLQLRKEGSTKQARKIYKLTYEGVKRVEQLTNRSNQNG